MTSARGALPILKKVFRGQGEVIRKPRIVSFFFVGGETDSQW